MYKEIDFFRLNSGKHIFFHISEQTKRLIDKIMEYVRYRFIIYSFCMCIISDAINNLARNLTIPVGGTWIRGRPKTDVKIKKSRVD